MTEECKEGIKEAGSVSAYIEKLEKENKKLKADCTLYRNAVKKIKKQLKRMCEEFV